MKQFLGPAQTKRQARPTGPLVVRNRPMIENSRFCLKKVKSGNIFAKFGGEI